MLSFYHVTGSKRAAEDRHTVKEGYTLSPLLLSFYSYQKLGVAQDPQLGFQSTFKPFPFFVSKAESYSI